MNEEGKIVKRDDFAEKLKDGMRSLPVKQLLSSPIISCVKAQQKLSENAFDSLMGQAFEKEGCGDAYHAAFVSFSYFQNGVAKRINVPLLLLVPYQPLEIKEASFSFSGNLFHTDGALVTDARRDRGFGSNRNVDENLKINFNVKAKSADMTIGLSKLFQFCTESVVVESHRKNVVPPRIDPIWPNPIWPDPKHPIYPFPPRSSYRPLGSGGSGGSGRTSGSGLNLNGIIDSINLPRPTSHGGSFLSYSSYKGHNHSYSSSWHLNNSLRKGVFERLVRVSSCLRLGFPKSGSYSMGLSLEGILDSINRMKRTRKRRGVLLPQPSRIRKGKRKNRK